MQQNNICKGTTYFFARKNVLGKQRVILYISYFLNPQFYEFSEAIYNVVVYDVGNFKAARYVCCRDLVDAGLILKVDSK